jgi:transcriptional regulator with XRE-family HTH domain
MKALRTWLKRTETTQTDLARQCGVSQATISDICRGVHLPSATLLKRIVEVTGVSADELLSSEAA